MAWLSHTGGVAGAIMLSALPAQTIATGAGIGLLAYAGKRRANGESALPDLPFLSKKDEADKAEAPVAEPAVWYILPA